MSCMMTDMLTTLRNSGCISLALIRGTAFGGGAEIATACDFRLMSNTASICFVHVTIGASPVCVISLNNLWFY